MCLQIKLRVRPVYRSLYLPLCLFFYHYGRRWHDKVNLTDPSASRPLLFLSAAPASAYSYSFGTPKKVILWTGSKLLRVPRV